MKIKKVLVARVVIAPPLKALFSMKDEDSTMRGWFPR